MTQHTVTNSFTTLASLVLDKQVEAITLEDLEAVKERAIEAIKGNGPFFSRFITSFPTKINLCPDKWEVGEKILKFLWREDQFNVRLGAYRHFKGGLYTVEKVALLLDGPKEEQAVIYFGMKDPTKVFVRPLREWCEIVLWPDGEYRLRFMRI